MSDYTLKKVIPRTDANTIKIDTNYFELNLKAKAIVDDIVSVLEENNTVMQQLVTDIQNIQPDSTYYTKEAIDKRISDLNEAKNIVQLQLLKLVKKSTLTDGILNYIKEQINTLLKVDRAYKEKIKSIERGVEELKSLDKEGKILSWQNIEYSAELVRHLMNTGIVSVNQIGTTMPIDPYQQPIDTGYSMIGLHVHSNYKAMCAMGWFNYQANGFMGQSRHNDYRLHSQGVTPFSRVEIEAPSVSNYHFTVENMQDLFRRYLAKELQESEKELFRWDLSYLECWWQEITSLDEAVSDQFDSFRHTFGSATPTYLANRFATSRAAGKKARFENIPYAPIASIGIDDKGNTRYAVLTYRIVSYPITSLNGKKHDEILEHKEDMLNLARFGNTDFYSSRAKFRWKDYSIFDSFIETIPGIGGLNENIEKYKTIDSWDLPTPLNKARYHRKYSVARDAVGRGNYMNGFNDPTLITSFTNTPNVAHGVSYMIPLEMVLRTPLETWNPNDLELKSSVSGNGTLDNPYSGIKENAVFYHTPAEFYNGFDTQDPADTGTGVKAIKNKDGEISKNVGSGIYITLPPIKTIRERVRIRYPIHYTASEFSPANIALSAMMKENSEVLAMLKLQNLKMIKEK